MTAADPWRVLFTRQAARDAKKLAAGGLKPKAELLLEILHRDRFQTPPRFEKLCGDLAGACSRRINVQHRLVYQVLEEQRVVKVLRMWTHYE
ncbi:MAG TPA: Txe/YoeB family addiction module toxin [Thermoanaerobaculia bacterium]|nr:Txe/YoeB family addiction module toxin [Thermoanaerobaculia bacterium]